MRCSLARMDALQLSCRKWDDEPDNTKLVCQLVNRKNAMPNKVKRQLASYKVRPFIRKSAATLKLKYDKWGILILTVMYFICLLSVWIPKRSKLSGSIRPAALWVRIQSSLSVYAREGIPGKPLWMASSKAANKIGPSEFIDAFAQRRLTAIIDLRIASLGRRFHGTVCICVGESTLPLPQRSGGAELHGGLLWGARLLLLDPHEPKWMRARRSLTFLHTLLHWNPPHRTHTFHCNLHLIYIYQRSSDRRRRWGILPASRKVHNFSTLGPPLGLLDAF